jgi:hypothetical protein
MTWDDVARGAAARRAYLRLYKGTASAYHPEIIALDRTLPFEVALLFRCLAHAAARQRADAARAAATAASHCCRHCYRRYDYRHLPATATTATATTATTATAATATRSAAAR